MILHQLEDVEYFRGVCDDAFAYGHGDAPDPEVAVDVLAHNLTRVLVFFIRK